MYTAFWRPSNSGVLSNVACLTHMGMTLCLVWAILLCCGGCSNDREIPETKRRGDQIIEALEQYHADHSRYPTSLEKLLPKYIQEIPVPTWGLRAWRYQTDGKEYTLRVNESTCTGDGNYRYLQRQGRNCSWDIGD
jgi:hypothetical protein